MFLRALSACLYLLPYPCALSSLRLLLVYELLDPFRIAPEFAVDIILILELVLSPYLTLFT